VLFLRGLRWRRGFAAAVLLVGTISAAVATLGPLYARAASESTLTDELRAATYHSGLSFLAGASGDVGRSIDQARATVRNQVRVGGYGAPIAGASTAVTVGSPGASFTTVSSLVTRDGVCGHVVIVRGRCATGPGEAIVSEDARVADPHWRIGTPLAVHQLVTAPDGIVDGPVINRVKVVGSYRPRDTEESYWFGLPYFNARLGPGVSAAVKVGASAIFVTQQQFATMPPGPPVEIDVGVPLRPEQVRLADVAALRKNVAAVQRRFPRDTPQPGPPQLRTDLPSVLDAAARDKHQVETATLVVICELAALALLVLFQVVGRAVDARGDEIALAKLRGLSPARTVSFALGEAMVLLLVAAPLGSALGFGVTLLLAHGALVTGTPVTWTAATSWALAAAVAGSLLAAALAAARTLTRPVLEQWRFTSPPRHSTRLLLAFDVLVAALAAVALVSLRRHGEQPRSIYLLAPTLLVIAVALIGVRVLPRLARLGLRPTRASRYLATFLALRQTVRRPGGMRLAALLAVAVGLATFALSGEAVARANRSARAQTEIGAPVQLGVQFGAGHDPQAAVAKADPRGDWAMAAAMWTAEGGRGGGPTINGPVLGVEPKRLVAVGYPVRGQVTPQEIADEITAPGAAPALFTGTAIRVTLTTTKITGDAPGVRVNVRALHAQSQPFDAGPLQLGRHDYTARVACQEGCAFTGVNFSPNFDATRPMSATVTVERVAAARAGTFRPLPVELRRPSGWRAEQIGLGATLRISRAPSGIQAELHSDNTASPVLTYAEAPNRLPVIATPRSLSTAHVRVGSLLDYAGDAADYRVVRFADPLPVVLDEGALVNLDYLRIRVLGFDREASWSVWLGPQAPADAVARLEKAGLIVQNRITESGRRAELGRQGPALGLLLLLACAIAAAVLAIGGTAVALLADARRRSFELAALRVVGVRRTTLRRSAVAEQVLLLGAAVLLGLPSGYAAARLVLPVVPEFSDPTPVALRYSPPVLIALATAAALAVLLWVAAVVAGWALARAAVPARLREAAR
jgi:hypothetical protein